MASRKRKRYLAIIVNANEVLPTPCRIYIFTTLNMCTGLLENNNISTISKQFLYHYLFKIRNITTIHKDYKKRQRPGELNKRQCYLTIRYISQSKRLTANVSMRMNFYKSPQKPKLTTPFSYKLLTETGESDENVLDRGPR